MECIVKVLDSHSPVSPVDIKIQRHSSPTHKIHSDDLAKRAMEMTQSVKCLLGNHGDLSWDPQHPCECMHAPVTLELGVWGGQRQRDL